MVNFTISFGSFVIGVGCLVVGAAQVYRPAAWIVMGMALIAVAFWPRVRQP